MAGSSRKKSTWLMPLSGATKMYWTPPSSWPASATGALRLGEALTTRAGEPAVAMLKVTGSVAELAPVAATVTDPVWLPGARPLASTDTVSVVGAEDADSVVESHGWFEDATTGALDPSLSLTSTGPL